MVRFEILTEQKFNNNFGSFSKSESYWEEIDESIVDILLKTRYKNEFEEIKAEIIEGRSIPAIVGYIRKQTELEKCPLCGSSFKEPYYALSIVDNETKVCPKCGEREQLESYFNVYER